MTTVHMIGNAHIDPVWLWGWQAGVDEALATLSAAADRCDESPDFIFTRGEAWLYQQAERLRPELFTRIRAQIAAGRWFIAGGTTLQPDLNLPTAFALRRQIRHGQAYFQSRFGVRPRIGYNVDAFGQPAFLPDLLAEHGYTATVFTRPIPAQVQIPFAAFRWRGAGGAELPAFRIVPGYANSLPDLHAHIIEAVAAADPALGHTMCFYGVGDHGGGPTKAQIAWIRAHRTSFPGIELRFSTPQAFFDAIAGKPLPLVEGELQHCFPGCYSVMSDIKRAQRHGEHLLDQAERTAIAFTPDPAAHLAKIDTAWNDLLFTAFHDIVTGTATPSAWASIRAMQGRARIAAEETLLDTTRAWAHRTLPPCADQRIVILNPDDTPFADLVECETWLDYDLWDTRCLADADGTPIPFQQVQPDAMHRIPRLLFPASIAPRAASIVRIRATPALTLAPTLASATDLEVSATRLANRHIALELGPTGIPGIALHGRRMLGATLQLRHDHADTWGADTDCWREPIAASLDGGAWQVEETGPLRARARLEARLGTSRLRWTVSLQRDDSRVFMRLEINFDDRFTPLQLALRLAGPPLRRTDAVPGGAIARPLAATEYPVQGWSRLTTGDTDIALVTQDAFSLSAQAGLWQWTLMRSPRMAWQGGDPPVYQGRDSFTDQGAHDLSFELHFGPALSDTTLDTAARRMAQKPITFDRTDGMDRPLW